MTTTTTMTATCHVCGRPTHNLSTLHGDCLRCVAAAVAASLRHDGYDVAPAVAERAAVAMTTARLAPHDQPIEDRLAFIDSIIKF